MSDIIVWAYSIYGDDKTRYYDPMQENIKAAKDLGVKILIFTTKDSLNEVVSYFQEFIRDVKIEVIEDEFFNKFPKFMRFIASEVIDGDYYFFKDSDSVVTRREIGVMNDFISKENCDCMIIRDHPHHIAPILAGMFGLTAKKAREFVLRLNETKEAVYGSPQSEYSYDQDWLEKYIYPDFVRTAMIYTDFIYFKNEKFTRIGRSLQCYGYIGAQRWKKILGVSDANALFWVYKNKILCIPGIYWYRLFKGKIRVVVIFSYLYTIFIKK
jgi:hypothetical protein